MDDVGLRDRQDAAYIEVRSTVKGSDPRRGFEDVRRLGVLFP